MKNGPWVILIAAAAIVGSAITIRAMRDADPVEFTITDSEFINDEPNEPLLVLDHTEADIKGLTALLESLRARIAKLEKHCFTEWDSDTIVLSDEEYEALGFE